MPRELIRDTSLTFLVAIFGFGLAGLVWGWFYPTVQINISAQGTMEPVKETAQSGFIGFAWFVIITCALALVLSLWAFITRVRGIIMMLWVGLVVLAGTWLFFVVGAKVIEATKDNFPEQPVPGDTLNIVELSSPGVGILAAMTVALVVYWFASIFSDASTFKSLRNR